MKNSDNPRKTIMKQRPHLWISLLEFVQNWLIELNITGMTRITDPQFGLDTNNNSNM